MGFLKKIFKGVKKVVKKVANGVKKVVKKVGKVLKKVTSSKLVKAILLVGAMIVTGGAAIGAYGGTLATTPFGSWMVSASQTVTGGTLFGTGGNIFARAGNFATSMIAKPFAATGKAIGSTLGATTDVIGITEKQGRMGYINTGTSANPVWEVDKSMTFKHGDLKGRTVADVKASTDTIFGIGKGLDPLTNEIRPLSGGEVLDATGIREMTRVELDDWATQQGLNPKDYKIFQGEITDLQNNIITPPSSQSKYLTGSAWGDYALNTGTAIGAGAMTGYAQSKLLEQDPTGIDAPLMVEGKSDLQPNVVYQGGQPLSLEGLYQNLIYSPQDPNQVYS